MNPEVKTKWIAALVSGEYKQGEGVLRDNENNFCCLGVLCDLAVKDGLDVKVEGLLDRAYQYDGRVGGLPQSVQRWAGMDGSMGNFYEENGEYEGCLADINDDGTPFTEIAKIIEEKF